MNGMRWAFFCLLFFLFACQNRRPQLPIPEEKLIKILTDVHYAEAALQDVYGTQKDSLKQVYYQEIFQLHETSEEELTKTMDILRQNPTLLDEIYNKVVENLQG